MIRLTRLNDAPLIVNSDLIEHIEVAPDTVIVLTGGQTYLVKECAQEVIEKIIHFRKSICLPNACPLRSAEASDADIGKPRG